ncbi:MAG TPA: hypothetical protein PLB34_01915 [Rhodoblastus sp.]|nr:hypothetical protein [Rhodoblastus sp.]
MQPRGTFDRRRQFAATIYITLERDWPTGRTRFALRRNFDPRARLFHNRHEFEPARQHTRLLNRLASFDKQRRSQAIQKLFQRLKESSRLPEPAFATMGPASSNLASIKSALDVANEALAAWQDAVETRPGASPARSTAKIEQLVNLLITTFPGDITLGEAQKVAIETGDKLSAEYLVDLRPAAVPLAIMRELLSVRGLTFDVRAVPSWRDFAQRYGDVILALDTGRRSAGR